MSDFKAPPVTMYQPGLVWFSQADKNSPPCPAVPVEISGNGVLTLLVSRKNSNTLMTRMGVRHVDDPFLKTCIDARIDCGGWDIAPGGAQEQIDALREELSALKAQLEELATAPEPKRGKKELANA